MRLSFLRGGVLSGAVLLALSGGCSTESDTLFHPLSVEFESARSEGVESEQQVEIRLLLNAPSDDEIVVDVRFVDETASGHDQCGSRDYSVEGARVVFEPGQTVAALSVRHLNDDLPEADEGLRLEILSVVGAALGETTTHHHRIIDDDRGALLDVRKDFGALGDGTTDDTEAIQHAIDRATLSEGAVIYFPEGDYVLTQVQLAPGIVYAGESARLVQAPEQPADARLLSLTYSSDETSLRTMFSGFVVDGNRAQQGKFDAWELQQSALLTFRGDPEREGRARVVLEAMQFVDSGGSGVVLGPNTESRICDLFGAEVFTDLLKLAGGNSELDVIGLRGEGSVGTTGIAITSQEVGFEESRAVDVRLSLIELASGDLEIDVQEDSVVVADKITMGAPPLYLRALRSKIHITDSTLFMGIPNLRENRIVAPHDILIEDSDIYLSETVTPNDDVKEEERELYFAQVTWDDVFYASNEGDDDVLIEELTDGRLIFERSRFVVAEDVEREDRVFVGGAVTSPVDESHALVLRDCTWDESIDEVFSEDCGPCREE